MTSLYNFSARNIDGIEHSLAEYRHHVVLIVNVASRCGFTSQYAGLENLYRAYRQENFTVLGFPCDQFGHQEPDEEKTIKQFCTEHYNVTFPLYSKIHVNGRQAHPLYCWLKRARRGLLGTTAIKWNFTKFLIGRDGQVLKRYAPYVKPEVIAQDLRPYLGRA